ncbi:DNA polymerase III subunit delta [Sulfitobacter sp. F26169L]|uniref:DNA polymerase III subunit delta n=1 Tax=Sulfitobacter sp. F26169L TaxID=2996015 RepID=UPI0022609A67|nr:DNA polymerase III subunit delta [Sulfitobacter sp. F26169L]MCX7565668.1 DNA polymerase III subunit delta [Sulfitobacter sp. F26169L]
MKLGRRDGAGIVAKPPRDKLGMLLYGGDAMRVALKRQEYLKALLGPAAEEEMRLTRIAAGDLRREPALLMDAIKAVGFFPGPRAAFVEGASEVVAQTIVQTMGDWQPGDAQIVVSAGDLKKTSKLLKAFEGHRDAYAWGIYDDPSDRAEIERLLRDAKLRADGPAMAALEDLARSLDPGDFRQTLEKLSLYMLSAPYTPVSLDDIAACAPASIEAAVDDILNIVAEKQSALIGPLMRRLQSQGVNAVTLSIMAMRHFRTLHRTACNPGAPVWGVRDRDRVVRQSRDWGAAKLDTALGILTDTDLQLRSAGQTAPAMAIIERTFIRLAMFGAS